MLPNTDNDNGNSIKYVIIDTDMGSDDAWALLMLLQAEKYLQNIKVLGITCVHGNASMENVVQNTRRILERIGRDDIPIFVGAHEPLIPGSSLPPPFHGVDGLADLGDDFFKDFNLQSIVRSENAIEMIKTLTLQHPKQVTLVALGPLTNIALAIKTYQGLSENFESIFMMGGNYHAIGNTSRCAEFNFYVDPEAANIVLHGAKCPLAILPWETCMDNNLDIPMDWRLNVVGVADNKFVQFLNTVETKLYTNFNMWQVCDALVATALVFPGCIKETQDWHATVELGGNFTRGQMVLDHMKTNESNVRIISLLCSKLCKAALLWASNPDVHPVPTFN